MDSWLSSELHLCRLIGQRGSHLSASRPTTLSGNRQAFPVDARDPVEQDSVAMIESENRFSLTARQLPGSLQLSVESRGFGFLIPPGSASEFEARGNNWHNKRKSFP